MSEQPNAANLSKREQYAKDNGISYDEALGTARPFIDEHVAHVEPTKQLFLEAQSTIREMQADENEDTPAKLRLQEELKTLVAAYKSELKYPSGNEKQIPSLLAKMDDIEAKLGKDRTQTTLVTAGMPVMHNRPLTKEQAVITGEYAEKEKRSINHMFELAKIKIADYFTKSDAEKSQDLKVSGLADVEKGRNLRGRTKLAIGTVGVFGFSMLSVAAERYIGLGVSEALGADGPTGSTGATGETTATTGGPTTDSLKEQGENYNGGEQNRRGRMSTEGAFDGTERNSKELDNHVLEKIKNNPSLMASVLEVRESGNKEGSFSLSDVNSDTRKYSVHGEHGEYSGKGEKAIDTLERSWERGEQGELLSKSEVSKIMDKYEFINHGTDSGEFKNAIDNKTYSAGVFDYRPDLGDKIYKKELGNGETVYFKVNEQDPTRDCLNVQTLREKIFAALRGTPNTPATTDTGWEHTPREPEPDYSKKPEEAPKNHDNGDNNAELGDQTTDQDLGGNTPNGNPTNPAPLPTNPEHETAPEIEPGVQPGTGPTGPAH